MGVKSIVIIDPIRTLTARDEVLPALNSQF
jgi:hypothetical protein